MSVLRRSCFIAFLSVLCCFGGLPEMRTPTQVFFSKDGSKMLVVLSELPPDKDTGRLITLPSGKQLDLREAFTGSGCYQIQSCTLVYLLDWRANFYEKVFVSDDLDHAVKANHQGMNAAWGLKFFTKGTQVASFTGQQLVGSKGVTEIRFARLGYHYQNWGYYYDWFDEQGTGFAVDTFILKTSPKHMFVSQIAFKVAPGKVIVFDQTTGQIVRRQQDDRFLPYILGAGIVLATFIWFVWKRLTTNPKVNG